MSFPVLLSGNEITDAVRVASIQGDGRPPESSVGIWEATTNLCKNGGFTTDTSFWTNFGSTITRSSEQAKFGGFSLKVVTSLAFRGARIPAADFVPAAATVYTFSAWIYSADSEQFVLELYGDAGRFLDAHTVHPGGGWYRITGTATSTGTGGTPSAEHNIQRENTTGTFYIDGVQIEAQPIATPYVETDGSSASRGAARARFPVSAIGATQGWVAVRARINWPATIGLHGGTTRFFQWADDENNRILLYYFENGPDIWVADRLAASAGSPATSSTQTFVAGDILTIIYRWTATAVGISINGGAFVTQGNSSVPTLAATLADVGAGITGVELSDSDFFWVALGTGTLTNSDAANIHASGNTARRCEDFPGSCVMVWPADADFGITPGDVFSKAVTRRSGQGAIR